MQGTIAMLMALGGLGCHHKSCAPVVMETCYSSGHGGHASCYASAPMVVATTQSHGMMGHSACYGGGHESGYSSCYGGHESGYSSCYGGGHGGHNACYGGGGHKRKKIFGGGGLFKHKRRGHATETCNLGVVESCYSMPVYGSYTPAYSVSYPTGQGMYGSPQGGSVSGQMTTNPGSTMMAPPTTGAADSRVDSATRSTTGEDGTPPTTPTDPAVPAAPAPANPGTAPEKP